MAILAGTRLGHFEVVAPIGAGGMGEVYKARDTRLDRIVAIKVLPQHLADKPELRERFEREARTIASLNHPHICTLHDVGHQDGTDFLVMEYVEGETLATRLMKGPLPLDQVLQYAIEISDALDKAHRKGVTHRDIKPGNVMLTKSGTKLLDFGLAKLKQAAVPASLPESQQPTLSHNPTVEGTLLGTLQYMAPEQVEGKNDEIDGRTDIFAFGALVYEMATGKKAFEGKTQASLIAKILEAHPPSMSSIQPVTPPALDHLVRRCLAKQPDERWQTASDVCQQLKWIAEGGSQAGMPMASAAHGCQRFGLIATGTAAVLALALAGVSFAYFGRSAEEPRNIRFFVTPPDAWSMLGVNAATTAPLSVSPDGRRMVLRATSNNGKSQLWVRSLDTLAMQSMAGTDDATSPFWSPDSQFLGFFAGGKLKKVAVSGGPPIALCDAAQGIGGAWNRDGVIVFAPGTSSALEKVSAVGGVPTAATRLAEGETGHRLPFFLPDGQHFLYRADTGVARGPIYVASLDSTERKLLFDADSSNVLYTQGHLLFLRETTLMAQPFDTGRLELTGEAIPIAEQIQTQGAPLAGVFSASQNGVLAYQTGTGGTSLQLVWFDRAGKQTGVLGDPSAYSDIEISPDGKLAAVSMPDQGDKGRDIWLYDVPRGVRSRFTFDPAVELESIWSPDASRIVFNSNRKGHFNLYQKAASGAGNEEVLLEDNLDNYPLSWSPDGRFILYRTGATLPYDLFVLPLSGERKPIPFLKTEFNEYHGQFSPDGRWVAYVSNESGRNEIYVSAFPGPGGKHQVSTDGGTMPRWRHDGTEIYYLAEDRQLMAAAVNGKGGSFDIGTVKSLFQTRTSTGFRFPYAVSPDGQRFLINTLPEQSASTPITVVLNWTAGLKK